MEIHQKDEVQLVKLWNDCLLDRDIAQKLGPYKSRDIANYRRDHQMPTNDGLLNWDENGAKPHNRRTYTKGVAK